VNCPLLQWIISTMLFHPLPDYFYHTSQIQSQFHWFVASFWLIHQRCIEFPFPRHPAIPLHLAVFCCAMFIFVYSMPERTRYDGLPIAPRLTATASWSRPVAAATSRSRRFHPVSQYLSSPTTASPVATASSGRRFSRRRGHSRLLA
jgi:hypothetical protein